MTLRCRPYFKLSKRSIHEHIRARVAGSGPWTVPALCAAYGLTKGSLPGGGTIGILELGGGWVASDMRIHSLFGLVAGGPACVASAAIQER